ncbi:MAG: hypothetical protein FWC92_04975 [Defluviitaleaceae bacterium]|nr:hypothetical protein [Defluviitaleaceae bacterium]
MGAFELQDTRSEAVESADCHIHGHIPAPPKKVKDECIVAYKVYDSCRRQNCLTASELGPAMTAGECIIGEHEHHVGEIIRPPAGATSVTMEKLKISKIHVIDKKPCPFRNGFWDVGIKFAFDYCLVFRDSSGCVLDSIHAKNFFNSKTTLFGSHGSDLIVGTDLFSRDSESITFEAAPFIWVEAKAVGLDAKLHHHRHGSEHRRHGEVLITIGLFSIMKLFRLVHLNVQSTGFCIPDECEGSHDINPCDYFSDLDFPMDIFSPPQRKEFMAARTEGFEAKIFS